MNFRFYPRSAGWLWLLFALLPCCCLCAATPMTQCADFSDSSTFVVTLNTGRSECVLDTLSGLPKNASVSWALPAMEFSERRRCAAVVAATSMQIASNPIAVAVSRYFSDLSWPGRLWCMIGVCGEMVGWILWVVTKLFRAETPMINPVCWIVFSRSPKNLGCSLVMRGIKCSWTTGSWWPQAWDDCFTENSSGKIGVAD